MAKIEIKNRWTGGLLFTHETAIDAGANLSGANLSGANMSGANLLGASLSSADLSGANLRGANLSGADLRDADLSDADLSDADLRGANLRGAGLSGADLSDANLSGADLSGANLRGTKWTDGEIINCVPLRIFGLRWVVTILDQHMKIGCQMHSLAAWASFTEAEISAMDGRNALRFWRAHKDVLFALAARNGRTAEATQPKEI